MHRIEYVEIPCNGQSNSENSTRVRESVLPFPQRNRAAAPGLKRTCSEHGAEHGVHQPVHLRAATHAAAFPIIPREVRETFINFVTERANGFRSNGRTLSITGTSPGANSISHSHRSSSNSTISTRLHPLFTLALFHPLREQRCALLRATSRTPRATPPPPSHPRTPRIVPRIVPKVFAGAAYSLRHARLPYELK